jgi:hypothetical protein
MVGGGPRLVTGDLCGVGGAAAGAPNGTSPAQASTALLDMGKFFVEQKQLADALPFLSLAVVVLELMFGEDKCVCEASARPAGRVGTRGNLSPPSSPCPRGEWTHACLCMPQARAPRGGVPVRRPHTACTGRRVCSVPNLRGVPLTSPCRLLRTRTHTHPAAATSSAPPTPASRCATRPFCWPRPSTGAACTPPPRCCCGARWVCR